MLNVFKTSFILIILTEQFCARVRYQGQPEAKHWILYIRSLLLAKQALLWSSLTFRRNRHASFIIHLIKNSQSANPVIVTFSGLRAAVPTQKWSQVRLNRKMWLNVVDNYFNPHSWDSLARTGVHNFMRFVKRDQKLRKARYTSEIKKRDTPNTCISNQLKYTVYPI